VKCGSWLGLEIGKEISLARMEEAKEVLTLKLREYVETGEEPRIIEAFYEHGGFFWVPRMVFYDKKMASILDDGRLPATSRVEWPGSLWLSPEKQQEGVDEETLKGFKTREAQKALVQEVLMSKEVRGGYGGILQAPPGSGKTVMGAEIILRLGRKAVVLVHKTFLMRQWLRAFSMVTPQLNVIFLGKGQREVSEDTDVCIAMIQTLLSKKFQKEVDPAFYQLFGTLIADEVHRYGSYRWQECLTMFEAPTRIGLSATPRRKDGATKLFKWHIRPVVAKGQGFQLTPKVKRVQFKGQYKIMPWMRDSNGKLKMPILDKQIVKRAERNEVILDQAMKAWEAGRRILILTSRRAHAELFHEILAKWNDDNPGTRSPEARLYLGGMKEKEYVDAEENAEIIVATYPMAAEGLDIPRLDVLIMATPRSDVEQSVGRILRDYPFKPDPVVVDIIDTEVDDCLQAFNGPRRSLYKRMGADVDEIEA